MSKSVTVIAVLGLCSLGLAQELLVNPSFDDPPPPSACTAYCSNTPECRDWPGPITGWSGSANRNGSVFLPPCPRAGDSIRASMSYDSASGNSKLYQIVNNLDNTKTYTFSGWWHVGVSIPFWPTGAFCRVVAELRDGIDPDTSTVLATTKLDQVGNGETSGWAPFAINARPTGTDMTVVLRLVSDTRGIYGWKAGHYDGCSLQEAQCLNPPTADSITPGFGVRGSTATGVQVVGANFLPGNTSVKLAQEGQPDIQATNVVVTPDGTTATFDLDLSSAILGRWNVVVTVGDNPPSYNCAPATLGNAFVVVLPAFSNGSFELPTAPGGCPAVPIPGIPTDWQYNDSLGYASAPYRDSDVFTPACPPPDGLHYASTSSEAGNGAGVTLYQTIPADNTKSYTFSGYFAGGGNNTVRIQLLDGDELAAPINSTTLRSGGSSDWTFAWVSGRPTGSLLTVAWTIGLTGPGPHANHADALALNACANPNFKATSVSPAQVDNDGVKTVTITGEGFSGGSVPQVSLTNDPYVPNPPRGTISATNVVVINDTTLTCDIPLSGASTGNWDVVVSHEGCVSRTSDYGVLLLVVGTGFVNGDFELADVGPVNCGTGVPGVPEGWSGDTPGGGFDRDSNVWTPAVCPSPADQGGGGHYGSLTKGGTGFLYAYQVVHVTPGAPYTFSGYFTGAGENDVYLALVDGADYLAAPLNSTLVRSWTGGADPVEAYDWTLGTVTATAASDIMTVVWLVDIRAADVPSASHADGLTFSQPCNTPPQDVDDDGDVDLADFSMFQACFNGPNRPWGPPPLDQQKCRCLDADKDNDVDLADFGVFQGCFNGPNRPPNCL
jgi:hypothetical protein